MMMLLSTTTAGLTSRTRARAQSHATRRRRVPAARSPTRQNRKKGGGRGRRSRRVKKEVGGGDPEDAKEGPEGAADVKMFDTFVKWDDSGWNATIQVKLKTQEGVSEELPEGVGASGELPEWVIALNALLNKLVEVRCDGDECRLNHLFDSGRWHEKLRHTFDIQGRLDLIDAIDKEKGALAPLLQGSPVLEQLEASIKQKYGGKIKKITLLDKSFHLSEVDAWTPGNAKLPLALTRPLLRQDGLSWYAKRGYTPSRGSQITETYKQKAFGASTLQDISVRVDGDEFSKYFDQEKEIAVIAHRNLKESHQWEKIKDQTAFAIFQQRSMSPGVEENKDIRDFIHNAWSGLVWGVSSSEREKLL
jgi:hypothetical protein